MNKQHKVVQVVAEKQKLNKQSNVIIITVLYKKKMTPEEALFREVTVNTEPLFNSRFAC